MKIDRNNTTPKTRQKVRALEKPLNQQSRVNLILDRIKEALMTGQLKPGDYLPTEAELVNNLGVGKSTIREAMKMLKAVGIAEVRQGHGTFISKEMTENSLTPLVFQLIALQGTSEELIELRKFIEPAYMHLAMEKATDEDIVHLERIVDDFSIKISKGEQTADDDLLFHYSILDYTRNPYIILIGKTILQLFWASVDVSMHTIPETALKDHKKILAALKTKDREKLDYAIIQSYSGWGQSLKKIK